MTWPHLWLVVLAEAILKLHTDGDYKIETQTSEVNSHEVAALRRYPDYSGEYSIGQTSMTRQATLVVLLFRRYSP